MSHTVQVYKSAAVDARLKVRWGRKHGRPRGRGRKAWRLIYRETVDTSVWDLPDV